MNGVYFKYLAIVLATPILVVSCNFNLLGYHDHTEDRNVPDKPMICLQYGQSHFNKLEVLCKDVVQKLLHDVPPAATKSSSSDVIVPTEPTKLTDDLYSDVASDPVADPFSMERIHYPRVGLSVAASTLEGWDGQGAGRGLFAEVVFEKGATITNYAGILKYSTMPNTVIDPTNTVAMGSAVPGWQFAGRKSPRGALQL